MGKIKIKNMLENNFHLRKCNNYKDSLVYKSIEQMISSNELDVVLKMLQKMTNNNKNKEVNKYASMFDILLQAYENGDRSEVLVNKIKLETDKLFESLQKEGLMHSTTLKYKK